MLGRVEIVQCLGEEMDGIVQQGCFSLWITDTWQNVINERYTFCTRYFTQSNKVVKYFRCRKMFISNSLQDAQSRVLEIRLCRVSLCRFSARFLPAVKLNIKRARLINEWIVMNARENSGADRGYYSRSSAYVQLSHVSRYLSRDATREWISCSSSRRVIRPRDAIARFYL